MGQVARILVSARMGTGTAMFCGMRPFHCWLFCFAIMLFFTTTTGTVLECSSGEPLGMENGNIAPSAIESTPNFNNHGAKTARLNLLSRAWNPRTPQSSWIRVDFKVITTVLKIITQGQISDQFGTGWVKTFSVSYGYTDNMFKDYNINGSLKVFIGNVDAHGTKNNSLFIQTRYIRVHPKTWHQVCLLRMELVGCYHECRSPLALGMESDFIADDLITSTREAGSLQSGYHGRLNHDSRWGAHSTILEPWLQVDFIMITIVLGVSTQGYVNLRVKSYQMSYLYNTNEFEYFKVENGGSKIFSGNTDENSVVTNYFYPPIVARKIRIHPLTWNGMVAGMRVEYLGCYHLCSQPLGMENLAIQDTQLSASSEVFLYEVGKARLRNTDGGWKAAKKDEKSWFQIDFKTNVTVKVIATQGSPNEQDKIEKFSAKYSYDGNDFHDYSENGTKKIFSANVLSNSVPVANIFDPPIVARFVRIYSEKIYRRGVLRMELYGCYKRCSNPERLGVAERDKIPDSQIQASSYNNPFLSPRCARLNPPALECLGWRIASGDIERWIQVDFLKSTKVTAILTQGRSDANEWISQYVVLYGNDGFHFGKVLDANGKPKAFSGSTTRSTVVKNHMRPAIFARFVRLKALFWNNYVAARLEFEGCYVDSDWENAFPLGMENRLILDSQLSASSSKFFISGAANARLNQNTTEDTFGGWIAADDDQEPWFQVDFIVEAIIKAIRVQMIELPSHEVLSYRISSGNNESSVTHFKPNDQAVIIYGKVDVKTYLQPAINARFLRVHPVGCSLSCSLKVEFYGHYPGCDNPEELGLGISPYRVLGSQITSSSFHLQFPDDFARLDNPLGWIVNTRLNAWIQVDFLVPTKVCRIDSLGRGDGNNFVKTFIVSFSNDAVHYQFYTENGQLKVFNANYFRDKIATQRLAQTIFSRFIRLHPQEYVNNEAMRLGLWGCYVDWFDSYELGMENGFILDTQITTSSAKDTKSAGSKARLNSLTNTSTGGWIAADYDLNPWLQVDFIANITLTSIVTQGLEGESSRVTKFTVAYGYAPMNLNNYTQSGSIKVFLANHGQESTMRSYVFPSLAARFVRIQPKAWNGSCAMRVEFFGRYEGNGTIRELGMKDGTIKDNQITVSSPFPGRVYARLNDESTWLSNPDDPEPWLQVDFLTMTFVAGIIIKGSDGRYSQTYRVSFCKDGVNFQFYKEFGNVKVFKGNYDDRKTVEQRLNNFIFTRYIRLHPKHAYYAKKALKVEFLGFSVVTDWFEPLPLGMESSFIPDTQLIPSSASSNHCSASRARLGDTSAWMAQLNDLEPWLQIEFTINTTVTAVTTQGYPDREYWVKNYTLSFAIDDNPWQDYKQNGQIRVFEGNWDCCSPVKHDIYPYIVSSVLRITPKACNEYCSLRVEIYGKYEAVCDNLLPLGMENHTIEDGQITASSSENMYTPHFGKLNMGSPNGKCHGWLPNPDDVEPWFQVNFLQFVRIVEVLTQGACDRDSWVMKFTVSYSSYGYTFVKYQENGVHKEFAANNDRTTVARNRFVNPIFLRFIRLNIVKTYHRAALRVEFVGCLVGMSWDQVYPITSQFVDAQFIASSEETSLTGAAVAKKNAGGWRAAQTDVDPWLQVDFLTNVTIFTMNSWKGLAGHVTAFTIEYSDAGMSFFNYSQDGQSTKVFNGHVHDVNHSTIHYFFPLLLARYVRIRPKAWVGKCVLEVEFNGRYECKNPQPLGMEDGSIRNSQLTASSFLGAGKHPIHGRLNKPRDYDGSDGGWRSLLSDESKWFQIDFLNHVKITGVSIQGFGNPAEFPAFTKTFKVAISNDGKSFVEYTDHKHPNIFQGNFDTSTVVHHTFNKIIVARFFRFYSLTYNLEPGLRVEIYGCCVREYSCMYPQALGMENFLIRDAQLTSSTSKDQATRAVNARLNLTAVVGERSGAGIALETDSQPWLRVDFTANVTLTAILTQGREDADEWVTSYEISFGIESRNYEYYKENGITKIFQANSDRSSVVKHYFFPRVFARYVRLHPKTCQGAYALRSEFHGCYEGCYTAESLGPSILPSQFTASSQLREEEAPSMARLGNSRSWIAAKTDTNIWLQVDFIQFTKVTEILIQGRGDVDLRTTLFSVSYSNDMIHFEDYREFGWIKIFNANFDRNTIIKHSLTRTIFAHGIRVIPKEWTHTSTINAPAIRMDLWGCYYGCQTTQELGMSNGKIRDYQIYAETGQIGLDSSGQTARLFSHSGWVKVPSPGEWRAISIDFITTAVITSIKTQGALNQEAWVTTFKVNYFYRDSMLSYQNYKIFNGNNDSNTVVTNEFIPVIVTQELSIIPVTWSSGGIGLRLEIYGCYEDLDVCASSPCMNGGTCHDYFDGYNFFNCTCVDGFTGFYCEIECFEPRALGMEHGQIADMQIKGSSIYSDEYEASYGRLNAVLENSRACWCPSDGDSDAWLQVDFILGTTVTSVYTQGNPAIDVDERVTTFQISYSMDGINFVYYKEDGFVKIFNGNTNKDIVVSNSFSTPISARYIRIHPATYSGLHKGCLRVEFKGCYAILTCYYPHTLGMENGQILDAQITASSSRNETYAAKRGRLNNMPFIKRGEWRPLVDDNVKFFEVDFLVNTTVTMVQVQAGENSNAGVKYYRLRYRHNDVDSHLSYKEGVANFGANSAWTSQHTFFKASTEQGAIVNNSLSPVIFARYIQIRPKECTNYCALRAEFYGCYEDFDVCESSPCQNNGTCHDHFDFFNYFTCTCASGYTGEMCQTEIDECMSYPCLNNGSCSDLVNAFNCSCPVDYYGIHCEYEFIYPIENFTVKPLASQKFAENISLVWTLDDGSYTSVQVYYNEILCCNVTDLHRVGGECNCLITNPIHFDPDGIVDIRVFAWNSVSNKTVDIQVEVLKDIQNSTISMLTSYANFGSGVKGLGIQENIFPSEYPVVFGVSYQDGPARLVQWDFNCDVSDVAQEFDFQFDKSFPSDENQECDITVTLQNNKSTAYVYGGIILKQSTLFTSISNDGPVKINNTITLTILFDKFAPETCMWIDVGDNSSLLVFGDNSCAVKFSVAQINRNIVAEPLQKFYPKSSDTQQVVIQHHYPQVGSFLVRMNASNAVSMAIDETVAVILALECENPNITINGMAPNSSNILNAVQVYRSHSISLSVELQIDCEITQKTSVSWTVFQFVDPRMLATIPGLTVSALEKTVHHLNIPTNDLFLPPRDLPYGFYEIVARVEMEGLPDVFGTDSFYVQIVQTPWINAAVIGGTFHTVPYGMVGFLNASASADPDFLGTDGMEFMWLCRDTDDYDFVVSNVSSEPLIYPNAPIQNTNTSGCFGTGRGRLNSTDLILEMDTRMMTEDETYAIFLYITKTHPEFGKRQHMSNVFFYVAKGLPPALQTNCYRNCKLKVVHDEKLILKSSCDARCYGELTFSWRLFLYDNIHMPEPYNLTSLNETAKDEFEQMACNPIDGLDIGVKAYSLEPGKKYTLALKAMRPSGVYGELRYTMLINTPPVNGNCSIFPLSGVAAETNFTISCENWIDVDAPLSYEFSFHVNGVKLVLFHRMIRSGQAISVTDWLGIGDESNDYKLNVSVQVEDFFGAKSLQVMTVQVYPPPMETLDVNKMMALVSGGDNLLQQYFNSNKSPKALGLSTTIGLILNHISQRNATDNGTHSHAILSPHQIRTEILTALVAANMSIPDTSTMLQISSTILTLTKEPDELTPESQDAALDMCKSLTRGMKTLSDNDSGFGGIATSALLVVGSLGQMSNASTKGTQLTPDRVKSTTDIVAELQNIITDNIVTSEGPFSIETDALSLQAERIMLKKIGEKKNTLKDCGFKPPPPDALGMKEIIENPNNTVLQMQPINLKLAVFNKNPFNWDNTSDTITSNVVDVVMDSNMNISTSNFSDEASVIVARDVSQFREADAFYLKPSATNTTANTKEYLKYHCFNRSTNYTSMNFEIHPEDIGIHLKVYLKRGGKPDIKSKDFQLFYELPDLSSCGVDHHNNTDDPVYVDLRNCSKDPYTVFVSNQDFNDTGEHCFAVQHILSLNQSSNSDTASVTSRKRRSISCEVGARRVRRSCVIIPPAPPKPTYIPPKKILVADNLGFDGEFFFPNQTPNYNMTMFESSCMHWDLENESWTGEGCRVAIGTNREQILCYCNHLTSFGSDLLVAPNPIDFDSVFQNFGSLAENVAVLALISTILGVYIIGVIWARRADKRDMLMLGPTILSKPKGSYHYLISTYTGSRQGAGTTARVVFKMAGDEGETEPVWLKDRHRPCFERGQENAFLVSCPNGVGDLNYLQIWHDNSGPSPSWYLSRLIVKDLQTGQVWPLFCENWLAVESEDGKVCRVLPVANEEEMVSFGHLFSSRAIKGLADGHIWFSIVSRPPTSNFTRVQRLSCALCLLCCTMITSAMFYNMGGQGPSPFAVHIGSLVIDLKPFVIGLQSSVIIVPVNVLLVQIFRNLKPKPRKEDEKNFNVGIGEEKQNVPKGKLPHWFIFVAYAICYLASAASIFFTLLYSIQWGKETSTEWVIAMVTSFLQSALLLQPIKVVLVAVVFALIIRKPTDTEEETNNISVENIPAKNQPTNEIPKKIKKKTKKYYSPPDADSLQEARIKRLKEIKMNAALKEILAFFFFLILLMEVAHYHRDPNTFLLTKTMHETFDELDASGIDLSAVSDTDSLWMWSRETLVPGLYADSWYNGKEIEKGWLGNIEDYLVGIPRVRLLRIQQDSCSISSYFEGKIPHCYGGYSVASEEDGTYGVGWESLVSDTRKRRDANGHIKGDIIDSPMTETEWSAVMTNSNSADQAKTRVKRALDPIMGGSSGRKRRKKKRLLSSSSPKIYTIKDTALLPDGRVLSCLERWRHQTMLELRGFPNWGTVAWYSGSGYVANLGYDQETAYTVIADLHSNGWIDVQTRAVFVEFTVYNANTNLFGIITIFTEFLPSSGTVTKVDFQASRFYLHLNGGQTLAHVLVIFFMLYFLYREGKLVYKQRLAYFKGFWNWIETVLVISEFALIVIFLARLYEVDRNLLQLRENPNDYVGFQYAGQADSFMTFVLGVLVFFYTIRFLRILRFNKNFLVIGKTLSRIMGPILNFCIPFIFGFFAFALFAYSVFSSELEDYSSFIRTMVTQFSMTLGDFDFEALFMVNPVLATLYFFAFIGLNVMVLMNMFIAIINDSYADIQEETAEIENEFEIVDYVVGIVTNSVYSKFKGEKVSPQPDKKKKKTKKIGKGKPKKYFVNDEGSELDSRTARLDILLDRMSKGLKEDEAIDAQFCSMPQEKKDSYFRVLWACV